MLQDIELVSHPTTGEPWYAPGPLAFEKVKPIYRPSELPTESKDSHSASKTLEGAESETSEQKMEGEPVEGTTRGHDRPRRAPLTVYTINRKDMLDPLGPGAKQLGALFGPRQGTAWSPEFRKAVWRKDMSDVILDMMRRTVVDALITRTTRESGAQDKFVEPVSNWETVRDVKRRQSVLWLPREAEDGSDSAHAASEYATLDVGGVQYYRKMAVHNLVWMLGSEEVARLRENVPAIFGQHEILVLKYWGSHSMVNLHMLLWRLHGYLARTPALPDGPEVEPGPGKRESPAQKTKQPKGPLDQRPVKKMARTLAELMPKS